MNKLKTDLLAAAVIGILASIFSLIVIINLELSVSLWAPFIVLVPLCIVGIFIARILGSKIPFFYQFGKFGEAGGLNWLVDFGFLNLFILVFSISTGIFYSIFKGISFVLSVTNSYFWNKFWVFAKKDTKDEASELGKFALVSIIGLGVNVLLASLVVFVGPSFSASISPKLWANIAAALGSLSAMMWNFLGYKFFVFKK